MPQHLLVAHDLSPHADAALLRADLLRRRLGGRLSLLHVVQPGQPEAAAAALLHERLSRLGIADVELHLRQGLPTEGILCMLGALQADLLLTGCHHSAQGCGFAASTPEQLLQACPALLVCMPPATADWSSCLSLLDFSPCASRALRLAQRLLPPSASLLAVNVLERAAIHAADDTAELEFQQGLFTDLLSAEQAALSADGCALRGEWQVGELHQCLQHSLAQHQPQLLALGEHHRGRLADSLLGSLTIDLLQAPPCDLLITR